MIELILFGSAELKPSPLIKTIIETQASEVAEQTQPPEKKHILLENESLYKIAAQYDTTWLRLFYKNTHIENPSQIAVGTEVIIPTADEELVERLYVIDQPVVQVSRENTLQTIKSSSGLAVAPAGWYPKNQCTHHIWSKRAVGRWNNASEWYWQAQRDGWATGLTPQVGAIGVAVKGNHVVYIEQVDGDRVYLSERNYDYRGSYQERWASASDFRYIY